MKKALIARVVAASLLALGSAAVADAASAPPFVRIGVQPSTQPPYIARELGYLAEVERSFNTKVVFENFAYGAPENMALAANEIDFAQEGMGPCAIAMESAGAKLVMINILEQTAIVARTEIRSVADLKGKKVAHPGKGSQQYPLLLLALDRAGVPQNSVELVRMDAKNMTVALGNGEVAAYIAWDPHTTKSLVGRSPAGKVLVRVEELMPLKAGHYLGEGVVVREAFASQYPDITRAVVQALAKANTFIVQEPDKAAEIWSRVLRLEREIVDYSLKRKMAIYIADVTPDREPLRKYVEFLNSYGITNVKDVEGFLRNKVDPGYLR